MTIFINYPYVVRCDRVGVCYFNLTFLVLFILILFFFLFVVIYKSWLLIRNFVFDIKKIRGPPKIVDSCAILNIFNIKKMIGLPKIVDPCAILGIFNIKKMRGPLKNVGLKMKMG